MPKPPKKYKRYIIGIDEVGRGALAGPVVVAAVLLPENLKLKIQNSKLPLRDSKKLSPRQRKVWFQWVKQHSNSLENIRMLFTTTKVSPKVIDKINISHAANLAAYHSLQKLISSSNKMIASSLNKGRIKIYLDGGLYLKNSKFKIQNLKSPFKNLELVKTVVGGDEKMPAIMLASIIAKVRRDRIMINLHKKYPVYGFNQHKGYGTKKHFELIKKYGPLLIHRKSFLKKFDF